MNAPTCNRKVARTRSAGRLTQAVRSSIESLEKRVFLSSTLLYTVPTGGAHSIVLSLVNVSGTPTVQISDNGVATQQALAATSAVAIAGGAGDDSLVVDFSGGNPIPAGVALSFDGGAGANSLTLQNGTFSTETYSPSGAAAGTISLGGSTVSYLNLGRVTDTATVNNLTMRPTTADQTVNFGSGLANTAEFSSGSAAFVTTDFANKANVTLDANGGNDTVNFANTVAAGTSNFTLDGNFGWVTVNVLATALGTSTEITSFEGGPETVTIGDSGNVQNVLGAVDVSDNTGGEDLTIDDSADTLARSITIDRASVTGIAPAPITFVESALNSLTVNAGSGGNAFTVLTTPTSVTTAVNLGAGNNTVVVDSVLGGSVLNLNGQGGHDQVTVSMSVFTNYGNETGFQTLQGVTNVSNVGGSTDLTIDSSTIASAEAITVTAGAVAISTTVPNGPATSNVNFTLANASTLTVTGGLGDDALTLNSTNIPTTLSGGAGSDTFTITPGSAAAVFVDGGNPTPPTTPGDTLNVKLDATTGAALASSLTSSGYQGVYTFTNAQPVHFVNIETLEGAPAALADVAVNLLAPATVNEFGTFTVSFTVSNNSASDAANTVFKDVLPADATFLSSSILGTVTNGTFTLNLGTLAAGGSVSGTLNFSVAVAGFTAINSASVTTDTIDTNPNNNSATAFTDIIDPALLVQGGLALAAVEGAQIAPSTLARFTDPAQAEPGDYSASVDWGDGSAGAAAVVSDGAGGFLVVGAHTYAEEGNYSITVTVKDGVNPTVVSDTAAVSDPALVAAGGLSFSVNNGSSTGVQTLATFTDPGGAEDPTVPGVYSATINWGDNSSTVGTVSFNAQTQSFSVQGAHTYTAPGTFNVSVAIVHKLLPAVQVTDKIQVIGSQPPLLGNVVITPTINEGGTAHLTGNLSEAAGGGTMTLTVNWGDGQPAGSYLFAEGATNFDVSHVYLDNPAAPATSFPVSAVLANTSSTKTSSATTSVVVKDVAPVAAAVVGPAVGVRGQSLAFADAFTDAGVLDTHVASINWGDGTLSNAVVSESNGSGTLAGSHVFKADGTYKVVVTVTDKDGLSASVNRTVTVSSLLVEPDPVFGGTMLVVGGTAGGSININANKGGSNLRVVNNSITTDVPNTVDRIVVYGQGGNDSIQLSNNVSDNAFLYGGAGGTTLVGGGGNNVLVGGSGNDLLVGGNGRNILIGGGGSDVLFGGKGDNLILSGSTVYGENDTAMSAIFNEWTRPFASYGVRVNDLKQGGGLSAGYALNATTVINNSTGSLLVGGSGTDWFLFNTRDFIFGQKKGEVLTQLN